MTNDSDDKIMQTHKDAFEKLADDSRPPREQTIRVDWEDVLFIEKSAYDALAQRLEAREKELENSVLVVNGINTALELRLYKDLAEAKAEIERHKAIENGLLDEIKIMQDGLDNWGKMYREAIKWGDSQSALIERCENAFKSLVGFEPFQGLEPRFASEMLTEIASFKKGKLL